MAELFQAYIEHAAKVAPDGLDTVPDRGELIRGLETLDIEGKGGAFVTRAVLAEAAFMARVLIAAELPVDKTITYSPEVSSIYKRIGKPAWSYGWSVTQLESATSYSEGRVKRETNAHVLLTQTGSLFVYREAPETLTGMPPIDGVAFNRYAPVCSTRINDRSVIYGFAELLTSNEIDPHPQPVGL